MTYPFYLVAVAAVCSGGPGPGPTGVEGGGRPSTASAAQIKEAIAASRSRLHGLVATFLSQHPGEGVASRHTIAVLGRRRFGENTHFTPKMPERLDLNHTRVYYTGETFDVYYPRQRYFETARKRIKEESTWKVRSDFLLECLGWWPPEDDSRLPDFDGHPHYLHLALKGEGYRVRPLQESVDGAWCHVLEKAGSDTIWVDPAIGFAVRRREKSAQASGKLAARYELTDYRQEAPGVWLPRHLRRVVFNAPGRRPEAESVAVVEKLVVNDVPESLFHFTPPPGTMTLNLDSSEVVLTPGGQDYLDEAVAVLKEILARTDPTGVYPSDIDPVAVAVLKNPLTTIVLISCLVFGYVVRAKKAPARVDAPVAG